MSANNGLRRTIVDMVTRAKEGHIPSSFSIVDILAFFYGEVLDTDLIRQESFERDYFLLSKGHGAAALYVVLSEHGLIHPDELARYSQPDGLLGGHPDSTLISGLEASTGSLGHGLPMAVGIAMGQRIKGKIGRTYVLVGDGECQEGTTWEAAHVAANQELGHLMVIVDWNESGKQLTPIDNLPDKWRAFGWEVFEFDGHDVSEIRQAHDAALDFQSRYRLPVSLIAHTVKGKGTRLTEGHGLWHHKIPTEIEYEQIMAELA